MRWAPAISLLALACVCGVGAASAVIPCTSPSISITHPLNDAILAGVSGFDVLFEVECAAFPGEVFVRLWDVTTRAADNYVDMYTHQKGVFSQLGEGEWHTGHSMTGQCALGHFTPH